MITRKKHENYEIAGITMLPIIGASGEAGDTMTTQGGVPF